MLLYIIDKLTFEFKHGTSIVRVTLRKTEVLQENDGYKLNVCLL